MNHHKIFVYGSLKKGFGNHSFLSDSTFLGTTTTAESTYSMLSLGAFPAVIPGGENAIQGELYEVDDSTLQDIDKLEGNGSFYERAQVSLSNGEVAWMYLFLRFNSMNLCSEVEAYDGVASWEESSDYLRWLQAVSVLSKKNDTDR